jgi:nucleotide-binding universal stress UspA family protein
VDDVDLTGRFPPVVIGVDGSPLAEAAAAAAVDEARRRLLPVRLVRAFDWPIPTAAAAPPPAGRDAARRAASAELSGLRDALLPEYPGGTITAAVVDGPPDTVLVAESASATVLVLGAHGDGRLAGVLGPVRAAVIRRSTSPVLSAAAGPRRDDGAPVIVGVGTGDESSTRHLLAAAALEAVTRSSDLVVVDLRPPAPVAPPASQDVAVVCGALQATNPGVRIRVVRPEDGAPPRLLDSAATAQLLVVGRGQPIEPLSAPLREVLAQSTVPVLVVPPAGAVRAYGPVRAFSLSAPVMATRSPRPDPC